MTRETAMRKQEKETTALTAKLATVEEALTHVIGGRRTIRHRASRRPEELKTLPDLDAARADINEKRAKLAETRSQQAQHQSERDRLSRELTRRKNAARPSPGKLAWQTRLGQRRATNRRSSDAHRRIETQVDILRSRPAESKRRAVTC